MTKIALPDIDDMPQAMTPAAPPAPPAPSWLDQNPAPNDNIARLREEALEEANQKRGRGRPPGSAAKATPPIVAPVAPAPVAPPSAAVADAAETPKRKRGRPPGSGNKNKTTTPISEILATNMAALEAIELTPIPVSAAEEEEVAMANFSDEDFVDLTEVSTPTLTSKPPVVPATPVVSEERREAARTAVFGEDEGFNGWADEGPAGQRADGKFYNRLGLESTQAHRHVAAAWQASGCMKLRAFRQEQEEKAEQKWDETDYSLKDVAVDAGRIKIAGLASPGHQGFAPTAHMLGQLANLAGTKPSQVMALYQMDNATEKRREQGEEILPLDHAEERVTLADRILNEHLSWLPEAEREKKRLFRFRTRDDQERECRALLSNRYGVINNDEFMEILWEAIPKEGREDTLVSYVEDTGNTLTGSLLLPDYIKQAPDSEYGIGLRFRNGEDGSWANEVEAWLFRAICFNGCIYGQRRRSGLHTGAHRKVHRGVMNKAELIEKTRAAINVGLSEGLAMFELMQLNHEAKIDNPMLVIALTAEQANVSLKEGLSVAEAFLKETEHSGFGIVNAWSRAAQNYSGDTRTLFERTGARLLGPSLKSNQEAVIKHWQELDTMARRLKEKEPALVEKYQEVFAA